MRQWGNICPLRRAAAQPGAREAISRLRPCGTAATDVRTALLIQFENHTRRNFSMKHWFLGVLAILTLVFTLTFPTAAPAAPPAPKPQPQPAASPAPEPHPEIREAIAALQRAREHMGHAAHDFGGHRADALHATDEAIRQLRICLQYDR